MNSLAVAIAFVSLLVAFISALIAKMQMGIASRAAEESGRAADAAERSAKAAEASAESARAVATIEVSRRAEEQQADLVMERWSGAHGLVVRNNGKAPAADVVAYRSDNREVNTDFVNVAPGDSINMRNGWRTPTEGELPPGGWADRPSPPAKYTMRIRWTDAVGTRRDSGWMHVNKLN